jgi:hypothetical protein
VSISTSITPKSPRGNRAARKATRPKSEAEPAVFSMRAYQPPVDTEAQNQGQFLQFEIRSRGLYDLTILSQSEYNRLGDGDRATFKRHKDYWLRIMMH